MVPTERDHFGEKNKNHLYDSKLNFSNEIQNPMQFDHSISLAMKNFKLNLYLE